MKVVNRRNESYTHYIGRPSPLGNPFSHRSSTQAKYIVDSVETAIASFEVYARKSAEIMKRIESLPADAVLGCWCKPRACHGDVIVKIWGEIHRGRSIMREGKQKIVIDRFTGPYAFLSNFYWFSTGKTDQETGEEIKTTAEHLFQAVKCADKQEMDWVLSSPSPAEAKRRGRRVRLVANWDVVRLEAMRRVLDHKFRCGVGMAGRLAETGDAELIEGNTWGDRFWGVCNGQGENWLGVLLMVVREELREGGRTREPEKRKERRQ